MKNFFALVKNERIKSVKTASFIVLLIIIILASVFISFGTLISKAISEHKSNFLNTGYGYDFTPQNVFGDNVTVTETAQRIIDNVKKLSEKDEQKQRFDRKYGLLGYELGGNSVFELNSAYQLDYLIECIQKGVGKQDIKVGFYASVFPQSVRDYLLMSPEELAKEKSVCYQDIKYYEDIVYNENFSGLFAKNLLAARDAYETAQRRLNEAGEQITSNPLSSEWLEAYRSEKHKLLTEYIAAHADLFKNDECFRLTAASVIDSLNVIDSAAGYQSYAEPKQALARLNEQKAEVERRFYSLTHGVPIAEIYQSTRYNVLNGISLFAFISFICIIIGGSIVSKEYSKGTVRLLLLGPVSRVKILLSKLFYTISAGFFAALLSQAIVIILSVAIYGGSDLTQPVLIADSGWVFEMNFVLYWFGSFALSFVSIIEACCFAVFLSTLFKNTALAVGVSIFVSGLRGTFVAIISQFNSGWLKYTTLPYGSLHDFVIPKNGVGYGLSLYSETPIYLPLGVIMVLTVSAVFAALSCVIFHRRQIK